MKCRIFLLLIVIISASTGLVTAQRKYTISGLIRAKKTGESLIGASVRVSVSSSGQQDPGGRGIGGTTSNEYGLYSLTLPPGKYSIEYSAVGLSPTIFEINLQKDSTINIGLVESSNNLEQVVVSAPTRGRSLSSPQMGVEHLSISEIKTMPALLGEKDVLKTIQLLPGIKSAGDGNSGFFVRGGAADQNLILLDEATVYNATHLLGFFSTFNSDAIKDITMYKGGMPAQYGGRLSSVLDIRMNEGNNQDYSASGGIGLISAKLNLEGPIQQDKSSFLVSGRRTYLDLFLKASSDSSVKDSKLYFYDLNAKLNYTLGGKDRLYLSGYFGKDELGSGNKFDITWGNATGTLRWNHIFNKKLFSNTSLILSNYKYKIKIRSGGTDYDIFSQIRDYNFKEELQWYAGSGHTVRAGLNAVYHTIRPGEVSSNSGVSGSSSADEQKRYSLENGLYLSDTWKATDDLTLTYGARLTAFSIFGKGDFYTVDGNGKVTDTLRYGSGALVKTWWNPEPRMAASYRLDAVSSLKASYVRNVQNLHLVSNSTSSTPTDKWIASTNIIKPELSDQVSLGYYRNLHDDRYELTVETYYKSMQNQIDYRDGANVYTNKAIESSLLYGKGRAYGIEWLLKKKAGRLTGWISYTLSKTERKINGINNDNWYNATQDRTHDIAVVGTYQYNKKWTFSASWVYYTGNAVSYPQGKYRIDNAWVYVYKGRNGSRMPAYHRLDLGATKQLKKTKKFSSELSLSLYNAYGRENAYTITFEEDKNHPNQTNAVQTSLFRFVPSISYNFKF